mgnify:CR=1 FL=1
MRIQLQPASPTLYPGSYPCLDRPGVAPVYLPAHRPLYCPLCCSPLVLPVALKCCWHLLADEFEVLLLCQQ